MWLYAGGVSLILPDAQFGMVSQDWVTYISSVSATMHCSLIFSGVQIKSLFFHNKMLSEATTHAMTFGDFSSIL